MSHFSVVVIGDNVDDQLAPYHEFECTGRNDKYIVDVDKTAEVLEHLAEHTEESSVATNADDCGAEAFALASAALASGTPVEEPYTLTDALEFFGFDGAKVVDDEAKVDTSTAHKYGYAVVRDGILLKAIKRTNPNAKWDWYTIGGRWSDLFLLHEGWASDNDDEPTLVDIDFTRMADEAGASAGEAWDAVHAAAGDTTGYESWDAIRTRHESLPDSIDGARKEYGAQAVVKRLSGKGVLGFFESFDDYNMPREDYVAAARDSAGVPYAYVKDSVWYSKGEMGWFGMSDDKLEQAQWNKQWHDMIASLAPDTKITVVDCHI